MNFFDRQILPAVQEKIRKDWQLSDSELGWLGTAFILLYAVVGLPLGRLADVGRRKWLLAAGVGVWSLMTLGSAYAVGFWSLFVLRLGVGVGEATCAPAASSLIGDLVRPERRARAMSLFMVGLPLGLSLSLLVSSAIAERHGWQQAFLVAGLPGLLLAVLALFLAEPERGGADPHLERGKTGSGMLTQGGPSPEDAFRPPASSGITESVGGAAASPFVRKEEDGNTRTPEAGVLAESHRDPTPPESATADPLRTGFRDTSFRLRPPSFAEVVRRVLGMPTMWWLIVSGALHNFNMYALGTFLASFLKRYHGVSIERAGQVSGLVYGCGALGIFGAGWLGDRAFRHGVSGRLHVAWVGLALATPCLLLALAAPAGEIVLCAIWLLPACLLLYAYYGAVYATIQDIVEPALRGTAMALYFCAMYLLGAVLGPVATGWASDHFARRAAAAEGANVVTEIHKAVGLHDAMYLIPVLNIVLVVVLFAASWTVKGDYQRCRERLTVAGKDEVLGKASG
jgi:MFS family permease